MFKFHVKEKGFLSFVLFSGLSWLNWFGGKNERLFTCSCACVYICCCEWDMFVWLTLFWHWWWQIGQIFVVMLMMMIGWSNLSIIIDDDWMTIIAATWKRKRKFFARHRCSSAMLVLCCFWSIEVHSDSASQTRLLYLIMDNSPGWARIPLWCASYDEPTVIYQLW